jgi:hypothetical protein
MGWAVAPFRLRRSISSSRIPRAAQHTSDRRVQRFEDAESGWVIAVRGDAVDVLQQEVAEALHFGQPFASAAP